MPLTEPWTWSPRSCLADGSKAIVRTLDASLGTLGRSRTVCASGGVKPEPWCQGPSMGLRQQKMNVDQIVDRMENHGAAAKVVGKR